MCSEATPWRRFSSSVDARTLRTPASVAESARASWRARSAVHKKALRDLALQFILQPAMWVACVRACVLNERKIIPAHHLHTCRKSYLYLWLLKIVAMRQIDGWMAEMWGKENIAPGHHWMNKAMSPAMTTIMIKVSARIKADTKLRLHQSRR